jgi:outer membrane protein OmpA-like peptidoglycan-associated protein
METVELDVEFTPTAAGPYEAVVEVFVDDDPIRLAFVTVSGQGVEAKLQGGGCSVANGGTRDAAVLLLALLLLVPLRRRTLGLLAIVLVMGAGTAHADPTRNIELSTFRPAPGVEADLLGVETPAVGERGAWSLAVYFNHAVNPLQVESSADLDMTDSPVTGRTAAELAFSYALEGRYEVGIGVPLLSQTGDDPMFSGIDPANGTALGDVALHGKAHWLDVAPFSLGSSATITVPTATGGEFAGIKYPSLHVRGIVGLRTARVKVVTNAGFQLRATSSLANVQQGSELTYGVGGAYRMLDELSAIAELRGAFGLVGEETLGVSPLEILGGVRYRPLRQVSVAAGLGRGVLSGIGSPDVRALLLVSFNAGARELKPIPRPKPPALDRGDDDDDNILNYKDKCPLDAEDPDDFEDDDGCPELDNDGDNIPDSVDKCPLKAEDADEHDDTDGCPDGDNDGDGIDDLKDDCPDDPEDIDEFEDLDGCDDPDNDSDGILDIVDQCATEAETINGFQDEDGCPDEGDSLIMLMPDRIEMFVPIQFRGNSAEILPASESLLKQIGATMRAHREFTLVRIGVHVHPRSGSDKGLSLSRAKAVRKWLTKWGVEPERLEVKGYGSRRPLAKRNQRGAKKLNDRVEIILLEKKIPRGNKQR